MSTFAATTPVAATQAVTVVCTAVGANWGRDFAICMENGVWGSRSATAERMNHLSTFERIQPGELGLAVQGFSWQNPKNPPRNRAGAAYGPRAPLEQFLEARFDNWFLFRVTGKPYRSTTPVWPSGEWDLRVPLEVLADGTAAPLLMSEINPVVAEALRMSGILASMPVAIPPSTIGKPLLSSTEPASAGDGELMYPTVTAADALGIEVPQVDPQAASLGGVQRRLAAFRDAREWSQFHSPRNLAAAIAVEAGELQELFLWSEDGSEVIAARRTEVEHEIADVLIQALNFANAAGIDAAAAVDAKIALNDHRYPVEKARGSAKKRGEL
jgi:NTP pyrophosphatase (non-canonical NTP hydrolase)